jgi:CheY-like chemotaxis protein
MDRILVVEDNRLEMRLMRAFFDQYFNGEFLIDFVSEGETALAYLNKLKYTLVITDLVMPKMDGFELISQIKNLDATIKIIAVSGRHPFFLNLANQLKVEAVFTKPIYKEAFIKTIAAVLEPDSPFKKHLLHSA